METLQLHKLSKFFLNKNKELVKIIVLKEAACLAVLEISTSLGNKSKKGIFTTTGLCRAGMENISVA